MIEKVFTALYADEYMILYMILYFNEDSGDAVFNCNETGILNIYLNNISLDNNFDEDDPDSIILVRLLDKSMLWAWSLPPKTIKTRQ